MSRVPDDVAIERDSALEQNAGQIPYFEAAAMPARTMELVWLSGSPPLQKPVELRFVLSKRSVVCGRRYSKAVGVRSSKQVRWLYRRALQAPSLDLRELACYRILQYTKPAIEV